MTEGEEGAPQAEPRRERGAITIYSALREDILTLRLAPGSAVDEQGIARQFGLSRTPVREALFMLSGEGLVRLLPNRSAIISPLTMENMNDYFDTLLILTRAVMVAAVHRAGPDDVAALRPRLATFRDSLGGERAAIVLAQLDLLRAICRIGRNFFLDRFYPDCLDYGRRTMLLHYFPEVTAAELEQLAEDYAAMVEAIAARDTGACNRLTGEMLGRVAVVVQRSLLPVYGDLVDQSTAAIPRIFRD
jgi:DNA-binding GntR family transcriptional regulator